MPGRTTDISNTNGNSHDIFRTVLNTPEGISNKDLLDKIVKVEEKIDALDRKLDLIFGGNVLIKGRFLNIQDIMEGNTKK